MKSLRTLIPLPPNTTAHKRTQSSTLTIPQNLTFPSELSSERSAIRLTLTGKVSYARAFNGFCVWVLVTRGACAFGDNRPFEMH
ncbi:hypothetical protein JTE90_001963 [Oedothorax gibbosus]|uniref:Uncharacterized protein n=1 Tax=Oedothorax gibbosus TaxID=931172 RepID=A0AAV6VT71_9ARAC|nr:hypothetical protein JTE90_001963 [Oedothorax gibbosus]